jgi:hypothetical protein
MTSCVSEIKESSQLHKQKFNYLYRLNFVLLLYKPVVSEENVVTLPIAYNVSVWQTVYVRISTRRKFSRCTKPITTCVPVSLL